MKKFITAMLALVMMSGTSAFAGHECQCKKPCQCVKRECPKR
ncbi:MAG TPA: hypothetical protein PKI45_01980 [Candidatus Omnitrophota bacterium]|nr:hypothetical protein [Candidatus Omnitrophota bacterium]